MLRIWRHSPALRLLLPLLAGILWQINAPVSITFWIALSLIAGITHLVIHYKLSQISYFSRFLFGITTIIIMLVLGGLLTSLKPPTQRSDYFLNHYAEGDALVLKLKEAPIIKEKSLKSVASVVAVMHGNVAVPTYGDILLYVASDSLSNLLEVDDVIITTSIIGELNEVQNPFEFNYKKYLHSHFIYNQIYTSSVQWKLAQKPDRHSFAGLFIHWREQLLKQFKRYQISGQEYAVLAALILGKTDAIDFHLMSSYASAGAIHVLAVSGLHVGLIYVLLAPLLRVIFPKGNKKFLKFIIPTLILWLYAGITGFSPSVLRAAVMFTAFIIAETYERNSNIFNTMSVSALLLLCINPYIIMEVGFQLSYLAVLGIVVLQRRIANLWQVHNKWLQKVWQLTAVSLAAQIVTFPLGMLYFHQFPNYFLVSNLIVIPLSTIILYLSLLFFALCWWPPVAQFLANICAWLTKAMNAVVLWFDQLPFSLIKGISLSVLETYLLFGIVWFLCSWFFWKRPRSLIYALVAGAALSISQVIEKTSIVQFTELCIHHIPGHTCITYCKGEQGYIFYDNGLIENESRVRFHLNNYWNHLGIKEFTYIPIDSVQPFHNSHVLFHYPYIVAGDKTIAMANEPFLTEEAAPQADYIIFEKSAAKVFLNEKDLAQLNNKKIFLSENVSRKKRKFLDEQLANKASIYDLKNGAFIVRKNEVVPFSTVY